MRTAAPHMLPQPGRPPARRATPDALRRGAARADPSATRRHAEAEGDVAPLPAATALLPADLLQGGEIIILMLKPSLWFVLLTSLRTLAGVGLLLLLALALTGLSPEPALLGLRRGDLLVLALAAGGVRLFWQFLEWFNRFYVLTDRRVIRVRGVLRIHIFEAPLKNIQHTTLYRSLRERLLGLGTIGFATAGTALSEAHWAMIARPLETHREVMRVLDRYR